MSYNEFLKRQSKEFINEALGKRDADLYNTGDLSITKFKERNESMTLTELEHSHDLSLTNPED